MATTTGVRIGWLRDDAVRLLLREAGGNGFILSTTPDPARARSLLVGLTLFRFDGSLKRKMQKDLTDLRWKPGWTPFAGWLTITMLTAERDPESWPFCQSEREFAYYAGKNFGGELGAIEGIYHPPSFYGTLARNAFGVVFGVAAATTAVSLFPEAVVGAAAVAKLAPAVARGYATAAAGVVSSHFLSGDPIDAYEKQTLYPRYEADYQRRQMT